MNRLPPPARAKDAQPKISVRYSEKLLRERNREERRSWRTGSALLLFCALALGFEAVHGFRTGEWVDVGDAKSYTIFVPPLIAAIMALCLLALAAWSFRNYYRVRSSDERAHADDRVL